MTASEKLRALDQDVRSGFADFWVNDDPQALLDVSRMLVVFPLIADVVEAMEAAQRTRWFLDLTDAEYDAAVVKYDATLTALREHLEGGDGM